MIKKTKNKKAQISSTLTWFVGFLIIFFVMMLFLFATLIVSRAREIKISLIKYNPNVLESQRTLINIFNTETIYNEQEITIKQLIKKWSLVSGEEKTKIKGKIIEEAKKIISEFGQENKGYIFKVEYGLEGIENLDASAKARSGKWLSELIELNTIEITNIKEEDPRNIKYANKLKSDFLDKASTFYIISNNNKIKVRLFVKKI